MTSQTRFERIWKWLPVGLWALAMVGLPLTSFPAITHLTGSTVAPFSALPLAVLALVWFLPYLVRRGSLPRETVPFIVFTLYVLGLAALAFFQNMDVFRNQPLLSQTIRSLLPFSIGLAFFLVSAAWNRDPAVMRRTLQAIHIGGVMMLIWTAIQALVMFRMAGVYPPFLGAIKSVLVTQSDIVGIGRLAGLTWEASWLADQFVMLYMPLWLAATYQRTTVFPRIGKISLENVLLVGGLYVFYLTSPRIGGAAFMLMLLYLFLKLVAAVYRWAIARLAHLPLATKSPWLLKTMVGAVILVIFVGFYAGFSSTVFKVVCKRDWRVCLLSNMPLNADEIQNNPGGINENLLFNISQRYAFLERTVYWMTGWHIFNDHPILGVGLGNAGYSFIDQMPAIGWASIEVRAVAYQNAGLPNIKSMYYRLLAETGVIGFAIFILWMLVLWASARASQRSRDGTVRTMALAGQLAIAAFILEGFSIDSFGLPYLFLIMGLTAATGWIYRRESRAADR
ncbi:MAG TPA: O-antigen ligase family protein [Anaerolineaceae bacterium]